MSGSSLVFCVFAFTFFFPEKISTFFTHLSFSLSRFSSTPSTADFNVVTVDDTLCSLHWCEPVEEAVQEHQRRGTIRRVFGVSEGKVTREVEVEVESENGDDDGETTFKTEERTYFTRGMTVARYQF